MTHSAEITEIAAALALAQGAIDGAKKNADNLHLKSKYANLAAVWDACREPLTTNGLSVLQFPDVQANNLLLETILLHKSGEFFQYVLTLPIPQMTPQGVGTVITYARRYALSAIVGIAPDDDDDAQSATDAAKPMPKGRTNGREGVYGTPHNDYSREPEAVTVSQKQEHTTSELFAAKCEEVDYIGKKSILCRAILDYADDAELTKSDYAACLEKPDPVWRTAIRAVQIADEEPPTPNLALLTTEEVPVVETSHNLDAFGSGIPAGVA